MDTKQIKDFDSYKAKLLERVKLDSERTAKAWHSQAEHIEQLESRISILESLVTLEKSLGHYVVRWKCKFRYCDYVVGATAGSIQAAIDDHISECHIG